MQAMSAVNITIPFISTVCMFFYRNIKKFHDGEVLRTVYAHGREKVKYNIPSLWEKMGYFLVALLQSVILVFSSLYIIRLLNPIHYIPVGYTYFSDIYIFTLLLYFCVLAVGHFLITAYNLKSFNKACNEFFGKFKIFKQNYMIGSNVKLFMGFMYNYLTLLLFYLTGFYFASVPLTVFRAFTAVFMLLVQTYYEELLFRYSIHNFLDDIWASCNIKFITDHKAIINSLVSCVIFAVYHVPWFDGTGYINFMLSTLPYSSIGFWWGMIYENKKGLSENTKEHSNDAAEALGVTSGMHYFHNLYIFMLQCMDITITGKPHSLGLSPVVLLWSAIVAYAVGSVNYLVYKYFDNTLS